MNNNFELFEQLLNLLAEGKYRDLRNVLAEEQPADIAEFIEKLPPERQLFIFRILTKDLSAEVFSYMDTDTQEHIVNSVSDNELRTIVDEMYLDDTIDLLSELPANLVTKVLKNTDFKTRKLINQFLNYPENSAGSIMTIEYVQLREGFTVGNAMQQIRKTGVDKETIYTSYVVNASKVLVGTVSLRTLLLSDDNALVSDIMEDNVITVNTHDDQEQVANLIKKYNWTSIPVTDNESRMVGIITIDDIVDVIEEENTEDFEKMSALIPSEEEYMRTSVIKLSKNRIVWLLVLMISGTFSSAIIDGYNEILSSAVTLAAFIPLLMDTGGNAGSQASTLIIRGMALGEIQSKDIFLILWKEFRVGLISGAVLGAVNFVRMMVMHSSSAAVSFTVSVTIVIVVIVAKMIGCMLPIGAKALKFDPAIMAGPLITTIVDSVALVIFFQLAKVFVL